MERSKEWVKQIRVLDGGVGGECQRLSSFTIHGHKAWSCRLLRDDPNLICTIHKNFILAGSDVISTNTYQASPGTLAETLDVTVDEAINLMRLAVNLARQAITDLEKTDWPKTKLPILVAGALGPFGACLADGSEYTGLYADKVKYTELVDFHFERAKILLETGVDFLAWETIPLLIEVKAICEVMQRFPDAACWISVTSRNGETTVAGDQLQLVAFEAQKCKQVFGVGVNCHTELEHLSRALENLSVINNPQPETNIDNFRERILLAYPDHGRWYLDSPEDPKYNDNYWIEIVGQLCKKRQTKQVQSNHLAQWIGGCCGIGPNVIRELAKLVKPEEYK